MNIDDYQKISKDKDLKTMLCPISRKCERKKITLSNLYCDMHVKDQDLVKSIGAEVVFYDGNQDYPRDVCGFKNICPEVPLLLEVEYPYTYFDREGYSYCEKLLTLDNNQYTEESNNKHYSECLEYKQYSHEIVLGKDLLSSDHFDKKLKKEIKEFVKANSVFLNLDVLNELKTIKNPRLDVSKLIKLCEELNDAYASANYVSSALLIRTVLNHVPPVFGATTFSGVVGQSNRSVKAILKSLNDEARPIADLHTHILMREKETLPSKNQIEPYKAAFEILVNEVVAKLAK